MVFERFKSNQKDILSIDLTSVIEIVLEWVRNNQKEKFNIGGIKRKAERNIIRYLIIFYIILKIINLCFFKLIEQICEVRMINTLLKNFEKKIYNFIVFEW